jgi:hypothetical protein
MSAEDLSVSAPTEEPHRLFNMHPPPPEITMHMNTTTPSYMHSPMQNPLYTKIPLPPVSQETIQILFNNPNALQTENDKILAKTLKTYIKHEPTILGLIETKWNFQLADKQ